MLVDCEDITVEDSLRIKEHLRDPRRFAWLVDKCRGRLHRFANRDCEIGEAQGLLDLLESLYRYAESIDRR